jgi:hypothetical protein
MKELITKKDEYIELTNDLTREMDINLKKPNQYMQTYVYEDRYQNKYAIRYPGATRGHIKVDENDIILEIKLYKDSMNTHKIYKPEVEECFEKYIGMKLVFA